VHDSGGQSDRAAAPASIGEQMRREDGQANRLKAELCWACGRKIKTKPK
jgi:hypothetical protein